MNHIRTDNRICNLRSVSGIDNCRNKSLRSDNKSGSVGVYWHNSRRKWNAKITVRGGDINLGSFTEIADAIAAREAASIKYGFHKNHGGKNGR